MKPVKYKQAIRWAVAVSCLTYIVFFFYRNSEDLKLVLQLQPVMLVGLAMLSAVAHLLFSFRVRIVLHKCSGRKMPFGPWFRIAMLGRFLNMVFPQMGNVYRSVRLKQDYDVSYTRYISGFASFTWMDVCLNLILALTTVLLARTSLQIGNLRVWQLLAAIIIVVAALPILFEAVFRLGRFENKTLAWIHSKLSEVLAVSIGNIRDGIYMLKVISTGIIAFVYTVMIFYLYFLSLNVHVNLPELALFYVILKFSNSVIISPGNLGLRELAYGIVAEQMGIGMGQGIFVSLVMRIVGTVVVFAFGSAFGGLGLLGKRGDYNPLRQQRQSP